MGLLSIIILLLTFVFQLNGAFVCEELKQTGWSVSTSDLFILQRNLLPFEANLNGFLILILKLVSNAFPDVWMHIFTTLSTFSLPRVRGKE